MKRTHFGKAIVTVDGVNHVAKYESAGDPRDSNTMVKVTFINSPGEWETKEIFAEELNIATTFKDRCGKLLTFN